MPKPGPLSSIEADPEFATLHPEVQRRILADAGAARKAPVKDQRPAQGMAPTPRPAPPPAWGYTPRAVPLVTEKVMDPERATLADEALAVMPKFPGETPQAEAARNRRMAVPPVPGSRESIARTVRETGQEWLVDGSITGGSMLKPAYDKALADARPRGPESRLLPSGRLVTPAAANHAPGERIGQALAILKESAGNVVGANVDAITQPSRFLPTSPGFGEGLTAAAVATPAAMFGDPAADMAFGGALMSAKPAARALGRIAAPLARGADAVAGDFAGRLGQAVAPAVEAAAPHVRAGADFMADQLRMRVATGGPRPGALLPERIPATGARQTDGAVNPEVLPPVKQIGAAPPTGRIIGEPEQLADGRLIVRAEFEGQRVAIDLMHPNGTAKTMDEVMAEIPREAAIVRAGWEAADAGLAKNLETMRAGGNPTTMGEQIRGIKGVWRDAGDKFDGLSPAIDAETMPAPRQIASTQALIQAAGDIQRAAPTRTTAPGARSGSIRIGRQPSDGWTPAQKAANQAIERKIRELVGERKAMEDVGNHGRVAELDAEIQSLDDARVVIPKPGMGPVVTIADLRAQHATATAAGDTATANRLDRQIRKMRAGNYYNDRKYSFLGPESEDKFIALTEQKVAELRAAGRDPRTPIPQSAIRRGAQDILPFTLEQIARKGLKKGESLTAVEYEAAKNYMQQLVEESVAVDRRVNAIRAAQNGGPQAVGADGAVIAPEQLGQALTIESARAMQLDKDVSGLLEIVTQSRSNKGRDLAYLKMVSQQGWDTDYWLARANRTSGGVATSAQIGEVSGIVVRGQQAEAAGDMAGQRQARIDLAQAMGRLTVTPWVDALLMARKAGLLSGVKTIARNASSNTINLGLEEAVNVIGVVPDAFLSMWTGRRTVFAREAAGIGRAVRESMTRGIGEARETMLYGMPLDQLAALDIPSEVNTPSRALNTYVNGIMRFQGAQDRVFKAYALRRSLDSQARSIALEAANAPGPRPSNAILDAHARYLADNPTEAMMFEAIADAEFATFQNDTAISDMIAGFKAAGRRYDAKTGRNTGSRIIAGMDLFMPFTKTPASIGARVMDYTVGTGTIHAARKRGKRLQRENAQANNPNRSQAQRASAPPVEWMTREEQRAISKGLSRQAIGATLIWYGQYLYGEGRLTGTDQMDRREENSAAGRQGNSIKVGDEWVPLNPFSPVGNLLTLGATMARDGSSTGIDQSVRTATQVLALMLDQPFTQGAKQFVEVAGDTGGRKMNRFIGGVAGSVIPSIVNEGAMFLDPSGDARAVDYSSAGAAIGQSIQARLPLARHGLPTRYTGLGDAQDANTGWRALAAGAGRFARENYDPVAREVLTSGASLPRLEDAIGIERGRADAPLTLAEQQEYLRLRGAAARQGVMSTLSDPAYQGLMPDAQRDRIDRDIKTRERMAKDQFLSPAMRAILAERLNQADEDARNGRGRRRAVVGPLRQP